MSTPFWKNSATQMLSRLGPTDRKVILGIGSDLRGDDAVGLYIARQLSARHTNPACLVIEAGTAPENFTSSVRRFSPSIVLLIDAAQMDESPGTIRWLSINEINSLLANTHALPLSLLAQYLQDEVGCQVALIGIQPLQTIFQAPLTQVVRLSADQVVQQLFAL